jgi:hypothetical protein
MKTTNNTTTSRHPLTPWNSTAGTYTRRDIIRAAWTIYAAAVQNFLCSIYSEVRIPRHDQRYRFNREAEATARDIVSRKGLQGIQADREKHRQRTRAKVAEERRPANILSAPIVRDYMQHRADLRAVRADRLDFYGRNHWAKDDRDRRALAILARHFNPATR